MLSVYDIFFFSFCPQKPINIPNF